MGLEGTGRVMTVIMDVSQLQGVTYTSSNTSPDESWEGLQEGLQMDLCMR
jgi:hypothetical protein